MSETPHEPATEESTGQDAETAGCRRGCRRTRGQCSPGQCKRLVDLDCGETGRIECVDCERRTLESMGIRPGKRIEVCTKHPFDGPVVVSVGRSTVSLSRSHARQLDVAIEG